MVPRSRPALTRAQLRVLAELRLVNQGLVDRPFTTPQEVAEHLVCLQGQHPNGVRAAIALRLAEPSVDAVTEAYRAGRIVRGYPMRGTVFATSANDLAWMTAIGGPRQLREAAKRRAEHGFTDDRVATAIESARAALSDAGALTRDALAAILAEAIRMPLDSGRRYHLLFTLMAAGELCYGPMQEKEHLFVDARTWLPADSGLEGRFNGDEDAAIAEWLRRYLDGHGPATLRDFHWWTKLPLGTVRRAAEGLLAEFEQYGEDLDGEALYGPPGLRERVAAVGRRAVDAARLLPPFDELVLGYQEREVLIEPDHHARLVPGRNGVFKPTAHLRGAIVGTWSFAGPTTAPRLELDAFRPLSATSNRAFERAADEYPRE